MIWLYLGIGWLSLVVLVLFFMSGAQKLNEACEREEENWLREMSYPNPID